MDCNWIGLPQQIRQWAFQYGKGYATSYWRRQKMGQEMDLRMCWSANDFQGKTCSVSQLFLHKKSFSINLFRHYYILTHRLKSGLRHRENLEQEISSLRWKRVFPFSYRDEQTNKMVHHKHEQFWEDLGINQSWIFRSAFRLTLTNWPSIFVCSPYSYWLWIQSYLYILHFWSETSHFSERLLYLNISPIWDDLYLQKSVITKI